MKKIILTLFLGMLLIGLMGNVIALESMGTFKQGEPIRITQVCSDATYITISSISYPNSTTAVSNVNMISSGSGEFYITFNETSTLGRYDVRGVSDGCENTFATYFNITTTGDGFSFWFIILGTALAILFLIFSLVTPEEFFVYISGLFFLIEGIYIMINGFSVINNTNTRMFAYIYIGIGILFTVGAYIFNSFAENDKIENEEEEEEY